jgi:hypothetical protein
MITTAEFRKQVGRVLAHGIRDLGFKGSGFHYAMETEDFIFVIGIQGSAYGGQCCVELGIQPKWLNTGGIVAPDFKKLKFFQYAFRTRLSASGKGDFWWTYSDNETDNLEIANNIIETIRKFAVPVVNKIKGNPNFLEEIEPKNLGGLLNGQSGELPGLNLMATESHLALIMTKALEKKNLTRAKLFAQYGLSTIRYPSSFSGIEYFEEILKKDSSTQGQAANQPER